MLILLVLAVLLRILATEEPHGGAAQPLAGMQAQHSEAGSVLLKHIDAWTAEREGEAKQKVRHAYDTFGRLVSVEEQLDGAWTTTATYEYAPAGQLVATTDAIGERTTWSYDGARRLRRVESPAIGWREYDYDGDRLIQQQDSAGGWLQQRHDALGPGDRARRERPLARRGGHGVGV
jgi:YD repeat-containing protein